MRSEQEIRDKIADLQFALKDRPGQVAGSKAWRATAILRIEQLKWVLGEESFMDGGR